MSALWARGGRWHMMLRCQDIVDFLLDYLDGELPEETVARLERHLADCPECVRFLETYRKVSSLTRRSLTSEEIPPELRARIRATLAQQGGGD